MDGSTTYILLLLSFFGKDEVSGTLQFFESNNGHCNASSVNYNIVFSQGHRAGTFQKETDIKNMASCIKKCCRIQDCDVAFMSRNNCYLVDCRSIESCMTKHLKRPKYETMLSFVTRPRRNRASFAVVQLERKATFKNLQKESSQMDHPLIMNATKQSERLSNFEQKYSETPLANRSEIIDIILAVGASIVAVSAAIIGIITMMRRLTDSNDQRAQYETIK